MHTNGQRNTVSSAQTSSPKQDGNARLPRSLAGGDAAPAGPPPDSAKEVAWRCKVVSRKRVLYAVVRGSLGCFRATASALTKRAAAMPPLPGSDKTDTIQQILLMNPPYESSLLKVLTDSPDRASRSRFDACRRPRARCAARRRSCDEQSRVGLANMNTCMQRYAAIRRTWTWTWNMEHGHGRGHGHLYGR